MRNLTAVVCSVVFAGLAWAQPSQVAEKKPATPEALKAELDAEKLIQQLSLKEPAKAEEARDRLLKLGPANLPALRDALTKADDPKFKKSLVQVIERLEVRSATKQLAARWGDRWYSLRYKGKKLGWMHLKTEEKDGEIVMSDEFFSRKSEGAEQTILHTITSRSDEYLSPVSLFLECKRPEKPWAIKGDVRNGRLVLRSTAPRGEEGAPNLKPNFMTEYAVMRLVTLVPKTEGYPLSLLEMWEKPALQDAVLKFDQEESIDLEGATVMASRYTMSNPHSADRTYWVDGTGRLLKFRVYGQIDFVLTDEKGAKDLTKVARRAEASRTPKTARQPVAESQLPVFPGAEGFGTRTPAGRGGKVIEVTSLADSGPDTLRAALSDPKPRIIVFRVGGTIELKQPLSIQHPFVTVAGQTAPGDGILLKHFGIAIETHDVLVQHLRIRPGNEGAIDPENNDAVQVNGGYNVVVDHVSASWGEDETVQTWARAHDVTFSWCLISEPLDKSRHPKGRHGAGLLIGDGSDRITAHHCLLAHNDFRSPLIIDSTAVDFVENVIYNWGRSAGEIYDNVGVSTRVNVIGNRYIPGPSSNPESFEIVVNKGDKPGSALPRVYAADNLGPRRVSGGGDEFAFFSVAGGGRRLPDECRAAKPFESRTVSRLQGADLTDAVLSGVGATLPRRDAVDQRVVESVRKRTGELINSPLQVGGYPKMKDGKPPIDADHDGIPDDWEQDKGLNPRDPSDASKDRDGDGYTNIEEYLHSLLK